MIAGDAQPETPFDKTADEDEALKAELARLDEGLRELDRFMPPVDDERPVPPSATRFVRVLVEAPPEGELERSGDERSAAILRQVRRLSGSFWCPPVPDADAVTAALEAEFPWMGEVTRVVHETLALRARFQAPARLPPILLVGPPGIGKTRYVQRLAELLETTTRTMSCAGLVGAVDFIGSERTFRGAQPGFVTRTFSETACAGPILVLDEIDKIATSEQHGTLHAALLGPLEPETARRFRDIYLDAALDVSHVSWVFTANDVSRLPEPLVSRLQIVHVGPPKGCDLPAMLPGLLRDFARDHGGEVTDLPVLSAGDAARLTQALDRHGSIRRIKVELRRCLLASMGIAATIAERRAPDAWATAVHEAGHAVCDAFGAEPARIVSLTARISGETPGAAGHVAFCPRQGVPTRRQLEAELVTLFGGRAAERLVFGRDGVTAGVAADLDMAQRAARRIAELFAPGGRAVALSEAGKARLETDVAALLATAERRAERLVRRHRGALLDLARRLDAAGTLSGVEAEALLAAHAGPIAALKNLLRLPTVRRTAP